MPCCLVNFMSDIFSLLLFLIRQLQVLHFQSTHSNLQFRSDFIYNATLSQNFYGLSKLNSSNSSFKVIRLEAIIILLIFQLAAYQPTGSPGMHKPARAQFALM